MKRLLIVVTVLAAAFVTSPVLAADVGVSISIGEPGFSGRLDIGNFPRPEVIDPRPVVIMRGVPVERPPIYLRVPEKQRRHWQKYCHRYNACGERVFFVKDSWYDKVYVPHYREMHRGRKHARRVERRHEERVERRHEERGEPRR